MPMPLSQGKCCSTNLRLAFMDECQSSRENTMGLFSFTICLKTEAYGVSNVALYLYIK